MERITKEKILLCNGLNLEYLRGCAGSLLDGNVLPKWHKTGCIEALANTINDPLSSALRSSRYDSSYSVSFIDEIYSHTDIVENIVLRKINETDYNAFLNGTKPVSIFEGKEYFLVKDGKNLDGQDSYVLRTK